MRTTNGALLLHNSSLSRCRGLSTAAGVYLESNSGFSAHLEKVSWCSVCVCVYVCRLVHLLDRLVCVVSSPTPDLALCLNVRTQSRV
jgi:hypothetical protein